MIEVQYTGKYPTLCRGKWIINIDGITVECDDSMRTQKTYAGWAFTDTWKEHWAEYQDGIPIEEWVQNPPPNLIEPLNQAGITITPELLRELYPLINQHDFRPNSCGGCI